MTTTSDNSMPVALPAKHVPGPRQGQWTYAAYAALPDDGRRYEVMNGVLIMAPAPNLDHQGASTRLVHYLFQLVESAGLGRVFHAPCDVELTPERVVQPDVFVVLNANLRKLAAKKIIGAPDFVIEIISPGTAIYDRLSKYEAYEQVGVPEYWLVDPEDKSIEVLVLEHGVYQSLGTFQGQDNIPSRVVPAIAQVHVEQFFV